MFNQISELNGLLRKVMHEAKVEAKRISRAQREFVVFSAIVAVLLGIDYMSARIIFDYLDPTVGKVSLGPEIIALCVPTAVIALHLMMSEDGGETIEKRLRRLSGVGVFLFLLGLGAMLASVYMDSADGVGSGGSDVAVSGVIGNDTLGGNGNDTSFVFSLFQGFFSGITPIIFFVGMTAILWVTVYTSHRLLGKIEERYAFLTSATRRYGELKRVFAEIEELGREIVQLDARRNRARSKLPGDPEYRFAQIASAAFSDALHRMGKALSGLDKANELLDPVVMRKGNVPPHIASQREGRRAIAELRQATTPYAILAHLDGFPAKEDEED